MLDYVYLAYIVTIVFYIVHVNTFYKKKMHLNLGICKNGIYRKAKVTT